MKREAKERQSAGGGDKRSDKAKSVEVNLPQAVEKKRNPQTSEQVAKKMGVSRKTYEGMKTVVAEGTPEQVARMDKGGNLTKVRQMRICLLRRTMIMHQLIRNLKSR